LGRSGCRHLGTATQSAAPRAACTGNQWERRCAAQRTDRWLRAGWGGALGGWLAVHLLQAGAASVPAALRGGASGRCRGLRVGWGEWLGGVLTASDLCAEPVPRRLAGAAHGGDGGWLRWLVAHGPQGGASSGHGHPRRQRRPAARLGEKGEAGLPCLAPAERAAAAATARSGLDGGLLLLLLRVCVRAAAVVAGGGRGAVGAAGARAGAGPPALRRRGGGARARRRGEAPPPPPPHTILGRSGCKHLGTATQSAPSPAAAASRRLPPRTDGRMFDGWRGQ
jgi:hypothetical protein